MPENWKSIGQLADDLLMRAEKAMRDDKLKQAEALHEASTVLSIAKARGEE